MAGLGFGAASGSQQQVKVERHRHMETDINPVTGRQYGQQVGSRCVRREEQGTLMLTQHDKATGHFTAFSQETYSVSITLSQYPFARGW